jgi:16S rRNA C1402 N4-methylase RsmH
MQNFLKIGKTTHYPVLYREVNSLVQEFIISTEDSKGPSVMMFDGTFGGGNHSIPLLD